MSAFWFGTESDMSHLFEGKRDDTTKKSFDAARRAAKKNIGPPIKVSAEEMYRSNDFHWLEPAFKELVNNHLSFDPNAKIIHKPDAVLQAQDRIWKTNCKWGDELSENVEVRL